MFLSISDLVFENCSGSSCHVQILLILVEILLSLVEFLNISRREVSHRGRGRICFREKSRTRFRVSS